MPSCLPTDLPIPARPRSASAAPLTVPADAAAPTMSGLSGSGGAASSGEVPAGDSHSGGSACPASALAASAAAVGGLGDAACSGQPQQGGGSACEVGGGGGALEEQGDHRLTLEFLEHNGYFDMPIQVRQRRAGLSCLWLLAACLPERGASSGGGAWRRARPVVAPTAVSIHSRALTTSPATHPPTHPHPGLRSKRRRSCGWA